MKSFQRYLVVFSILVAGATAHGDEVNGLSLRARRFFNLFLADPSEIRIRGLYQPGNTEKDGPGEFDLLNGNAWAELPVHLNDNLFLRLGAEYDLRQNDFKFVRGAATATSSNSLQKGVVTVGAGLFLADNLLLTGVVRPGVYSDWENTPKTEDIRAFWEGLIVYQINPGTQLVGGAAFNEIFDETPLYPVIGVRLLSESGAFRVHLTFPTEARLGYNLSKDTQLFGGYWISGDEYDVAVGARTFALQLQDQRLGVGVQHWLGSGFNVKGEVGMTYQSELKFKTAGAGQFTDGELDPSPYLALGFGFAF